MRKENSRKTTGAGCPSFLLGWLWHSLTLTVAWRQSTRIAILHASHTHTHTRAPLNDSSFPEGHLRHKVVGS